MADDPHKQALAALAKCIAAANVGDTVLETDECKTFPDDSFKSAPGLCFDVVYQKKCILMHFVVIAKEQGYCDFAVYGRVIREDGSATGYRSLEHLQYISSVDVPSGAAYPNGPEMKNTLTNRIKKAKEDEVSATDFCASRQYDEIKQMNVVATVLSEAAKSSTIGIVEEEKDDDGNKDASVGDVPAPIDEVEKGKETTKAAETPAADKILEAAAGATSKTTAQVRAWLVSKFAEATRFSKQSLVWVFDLHRGVRKGLVTSPPAIEVAADKNRTSTALFFSGMEVSIWGKNYLFVGSFYLYRDRKTNKPKPPAYALLADMTTIKENSGVLDVVFQSAVASANKARDDQWPIIKDVKEYSRIFSWTKWLCRMTVKTLAKHSTQAKLHDDARVGGTSMLIRHLIYGTPPENLNAILLKNIPPIIDPTASKVPEATAAKPTPKPAARRSLRPRASMRKVVPIETPTPPKRARARARGRGRGRGGGRGRSQTYKSTRRRAPGNATQAKGKQAEATRAGIIVDSPKTAELKRLRDEVLLMSNVDTPKTREIKRLRQQLKRAKQQKEFGEAAAVIPPIAEAMTTNADHKQEHGRQHGRQFALRNRMDATPQIGQRMTPAQHQFMLMAMTPGFLQGYMMGSFTQ